MTSLNKIPENLPIPEDDGACDHLLGLSLPNIQLLATNGEKVDFSSLRSVVIYCYPMTGRPSADLPDGWDDIPGARGCTPQSCSFRDHYSELQKLKTEVYGLSTQTTDYQQEAKSRLHLPFELVSDSGFNFINALRLPTFTVEGMTLSKRVTLVAQRGVITKVFYPVFPPDKNADDVIAFLNTANT
ncbi:peroxiredoxin [bacterium]|nr:peroxiredoxin [bacterium]